MRQTSTVSSLVCSTVIKRDYFITFLHAAF